MLSRIPNHREQNMFRSKGTARGGGKRRTVHHFTGRIPMSHLGLTEPKVMGGAAVLTQIRHEGIDPSGYIQDGYKILQIFCLSVVKLTKSAEQIIPSSVYVYTERERDTGNISMNVTHEDRGEPTECFSPS